MHLERFRAPRRYILHLKVFCNSIKRSTACVYFSVYAVFTKMRVPKLIDSSLLRVKEWRKYVVGVGRERDIKVRTMLNYVLT